MTEIYSGPWDPVLGEVKPKKHIPDDPYHPRYPDVNGMMSPDVGQIVKAEPTAVRPK